MTVFLLAVLTALWLGILTSVSPCPLATNLAAVSYVGGQVGGRKSALLAGSAYVLGRALTYAVIGGLVVAGLFSIPGVSSFLERYMNRVLGPVLILAGMVLLGLIEIGVGGTVGSERLHARAAKAGPLGAVLLGILFALSFCPVSAAIFFGSLVPLSLEHASPVAMPLVYGVGTGLPVLVLAFLIAFGGATLGKALGRLQAFEKWARRVTGAVFLGVGLYYTFRFILLA